MKYLLACLAVVSCLAASAQYDNAQFPYNPDSEPDGYIGVGDVLAILAIFDSQFDVATLSADSSSALVHIGNASYWECSRSCKALGREWDIIDVDAVALHFDSLVIGDVWLKADDVQSGSFAYLSNNPGSFYHGNVWTQANSLSLLQCHCSARIYPELEYTFAASTNSLNFINDCATLLNDGWRPLGGINTRTISNPPVIYSQSFWRYVPD